MQPTHALLALTRIGLTLRPMSDGRLWVEPRQRITPEARALIVAHRNDLLKLVRRHINMPNSGTVDNLLPRPGGIAGDNGCDPAVADARALLAAHDYTLPQVLAVAHRDHILVELGAMPPPSAKPFRRLTENTRAFLDSHLWQDTVALGWSLVELFGINPYAPLVRVGGWGLITALALSKFAGGEIETLTKTDVRIRYPSGSILTYQRGAPDLDAAVVWWECPTIIRAPPAEPNVFNVERAAFSGNS